MQAEESSATCNPLLRLLRSVHYADQQDLGICDVIQHNIREAFNGPIA